MIERAISDLIRRSLSQRAAVVLLGPRQVGKTTLALSIGNDFESVYVDLESPSDRNKLEDPEFYLHQNQGRLIIIDEVQRVPELFQVIRSQIDKNRRSGHRHGQFLLLGSASNDLLKQSSESLAGRVSYRELYPLNLVEVEPGAINDLWLRGGFPDSFLEQVASFEWRQDFIRTYLERDVPALGLRIPAETLRRFWTMLAHSQSQLFNASKIGGSLGVKGQMASRYLDIMVDLMLVRRLKPWHGNTGKRLVKSPKTYIRDSGVLHTLLGLQTLDALLGHPVAGSSWEGFVIENIASTLPASSDLYFYRSHAGAEIDLLVETGDSLWAVEIKRNTAPSVSRGFHSACDDLGPARRVVIYPGDDSYTLKDEIEVRSLCTFLDELAANCPTGMST